MSNTTDRVVSTLQTAAESIVLFALVGIGMGFAASLILSQFGTNLGGTVLSGFGAVTVLLVGFLIAPLIAVVAGLRTGRRLGRSIEGYVASFTGCFAGSLLLLFTIVVFLAVGIVSGTPPAPESAASAGAEDAVTATPTAGGGAATSDSGQQIDIAQYLVPILAASLPNALVGLVAALLGSYGRLAALEDAGVGAGSTAMTPRRLGAMMGVLLVVGAAGIGASAFVGSMAGPQDVEIVEGPDYPVAGNTITADLSVRNTGGSSVTTSVTARMITDGDTDPDLSSTKEVTVAAGQIETLRIGFVETNDSGVKGASEAQQQAISNENYRLEILINGEVRSTRLP